jgi:hypothetical protein
MTASALETSLNAIEGKVDDLLAAFENKGNSTLEESTITQHTGSQPGASEDQEMESLKSPSK